MYWQNTHKCTLSMCEPLHISQIKNDASIFSFPLYTCIFFFGGGGQDLHSWNYCSALLPWLKVLHKNVDFSFTSTFYNTNTQLWHWFLPFGQKWPGVLHIFLWNLRVNIVINLHSKCLPSFFVWLISKVNV